MNKPSAFCLLFVFLFFLLTSLPNDSRAQTTNTMSQTSLATFNDIMNKLNEMDKKLNELDKKFEVRLTRLETKMENLEVQIKDNKTDMWTLFGSLIVLYLFVLGVVLAIYRNVKIGKVSRTDRISKSFMEEIRSQLQTMNEQIRQMSRREEMLEKRLAELENSRKAN
ncbi:MAG: hypothetical protein ONB05_03515 [candidate division KSB1 bacterium]|nr:hypothetical protein [candidate division KSB1 bacterium]